MSLSFPLQHQSAYTNGVLLFLNSRVLRLANIIIYSGAESHLSYSNQKFMLQVSQIFAVQKPVPIEPLSDRMGRLSLRPWVPTVDGQNSIPPSEILLLYPTCGVDFVGALSNIGFPWWHHSLFYETISLQRASTCVGVVPAQWEHNTPSCRNWHSLPHQLGSWNRGGSSDFTLNYPGTS